MSQENKPSDPNPQPMESITCDICWVTWEVPKPKPHTQEKTKCPQCGLIIVVDAVTPWNDQDDMVGG